MWGSKRKKFVAWARSWSLGEALCALFVWAAVGVLVAGLVVIAVEDGLAGLGSLALALGQVVLAGVVAWGLVRLVLWPFRSD